MLVCSITNLSSTEEIPVGGLPAPFQYVTIAASGSADAVTTLRDLQMVQYVTTGFTNGEVLQQLVQMGKISVAWADLGATDRSEVDMAHGEHSGD